PRQTHRAGARLRPYELALLEPLGKHTQSLSVPPQELDAIAAPSTEDKHVAAECILVQLGLRQRRQAIKALPHIGGARRQPHARSCRQPDHRRARAFSTASSLASETVPCR